MPGERRSRKIRVWVGVLVLVGATAYLMATGFRGATTYYLLPEEALNRAAQTGRSLPVRIRGRVEPGTLGFDPAAMAVRFRLGPDLAGQDGGAAGDPSTASAAARTAPGNLIDVAYRGAPPDNLAEGKQVIVEGRLGPDGRLTASQLLVTCPSRYESDK
ncbi:MAG: cytochrome c maturation protein CcmE [Bacillota bacterium]